MSRDGWAALPRGATGLSAVCDCGISWSYSLTFFAIACFSSLVFVWVTISAFWLCNCNACMQASVLNEHTNEPRHEISNILVCANRKGSDQPAHKRSLIRVFANRLNILWALSYWWTSFGASKLKRRLHRLVWVYTCQNTILLEITCRGSNALLHCFSLMRIPFFKHAYSDKMHAGARKRHSAAL